MWPGQCAVTRRTSSGSSLFSFFDGDFAPIFGQIVSIIVETIRNTSLGTSRCFRTKKDLNVFVTV